MRLGPGNPDALCNLARALEDDPTSPIKESESLYRFTQPLNPPELEPCLAPLAAPQRPSPSSGPLKPCAELA